MRRGVPCVGCAYHIHGLFGRKVAAADVQLGDPVRLAYFCSFFSNFTAFLIRWPLDMLVELLSREECLVYAIHKDVAKGRPYVSK